MVSTPQERLADSWADENGPVLVPPESAAAIC